PFTSEELTGNDARLSVLLNCTGSEYPVATLPYGSRAVTWKLPGAAAVVGEGKPVTWKVLAFAGSTTIGGEVPLSMGVTVSATEIVCVPAVNKVAPAGKV